VDDGHTQRALAAALIQPQCYPHPVGTVRVIETHISRVFLTGDYAYKLKKPLDLGFLDFTTLAQRREACADEVRLNRRLAPQIYLDAVPIIGSVDAPRIGGSGMPIEWAVRMREFPQSALLSSMAETGALETAHIDAVADLLASFHGGLPPAPASSPYASAARITADARDNFAALRPLVRGTALEARVESLRAWSDAAADRLAAAFDRRRHGGHVRECHGDLHLANLAWVDGAPLAFDCIEFNPALRWIDVASELAFTMMDLAAYGAAPLANRLLNRYLEHTADYGLLEVLDFYLAYRALVRAKIAALGAAEHHHPAAADAWVARYLGTAQAVCQPRRPWLAITHGLAGSGKSTAALAAATATGALRLRSDVIRKQLHGFAPGARSRSGPGAGLYTPAATDATYQCLAEMARLALEAGFPVVADATFLRREYRLRFAHLACERAVPFAILHTAAPAPLLRVRIAQRAQAGQDPSEADAAIMDRQQAAAEPLGPDEQTHEVRVDATNPAAVVAALAAHGCGVV